MKQHINKLKKTNQCLFESTFIQASFSGLQLGKRGGGAAIINSQQLAFLKAQTLWMQQVSRRWDVRSDSGTDATGRIQGGDPEPRSSRPPPAPASGSEHVPPQ